MLPGFDNNDIFLWPRGAHRLISCRSAPGKNNQTATTVNSLTTVCSSPDHAAPHLLYLHHNQVLLTFSVFSFSFSPRSSLPKGNIKSVFSLISCTPTHQGVYQDSKGRHVVCCPLIGDMLITLKWSTKPGPVFTNVKFTLKALLRNYKIDLHFKRRKIVHHFEMSLWITLARSVKQSVSHANKPTCDNSERFREYLPRSSFCVLEDSSYSWHSL